MARTRHQIPGRRAKHHRNPFIRFLYEVVGTAMIITAALMVVFLTIAVWQVGYWWVSIPLVAVFGGIVFLLSRGARA